MNFSIKNDNPFRIFAQLQNIAHEHRGAKNTIDLSRGDPGLWFSPSQAGRNFFSFLIAADALLNNEHKNYKRDFVGFDGEMILHFIEEWLEGTYSQKTLQKFMSDFRLFLENITTISEKQGNPLTKREIFDELFLFSNVSGGHYHLPEGEKIVRIVIADQLKKICQQDIPISNIIETSGASHGIATLFKLCTHPDIKFLSEGDTVLSISPNYSPYNDLFRQFKLDVQPLMIDSESGEVDLSSAKNLKKKVKLISMIDPNNPTGHMIRPDQLVKIAELARELDAIILTDEIYAEFFLDRHTSVIDFAPERTLLLGGTSKIQRSTGLRLGYFAFTDECADYLTKKILNWVGDIRKSLINAKAPGWIQWVFYHVSCVPWPSQFLALSHMVFGEIEKQNYIQKVQKNMNTFFEVIKRPYKNNMYFAILDLDPHNNATSAEELFVWLAKKWIVVIPAYNFFSSNMRTDKHLTYARVSIPNATHEQIIDAAQVIRDMIL